jgi:hypothetical protein
VRLLRLMVPLSGTENVLGLSKPIWRDPMMPRSHTGQRWLVRLSMLVLVSQANATALVSQTASTALAWSPFEPSSGPTAACATDTRYLALSFLEGLWRVQIDGTPRTPRSRLSWILSGCALLEEYAGGAGRSVTYRDPVSGVWHQDYVDSQQLTLRLFGTVAADTLVMRDSGQVGRDGRRSFNRFQWSRRTTEPGFVQEWWVRRPSAARFEKIFTGVYGYWQDTVPTRVATRDSTCERRLTGHGLWALIGQWTTDQDSAARISAAWPAAPCTLEVRATGPDGYEGLTMIYEDVATHTLHLIFADNRGSVARLREGSTRTNSKVRHVLLGWISHSNGRRVRTRIALSRSRDRATWTVWEEGRGERKIQWMRKP